MSWFAKTQFLGSKPQKSVWDLTTFGTIYGEVIVPDGGQAGSRREAMKNEGWPVFWARAMNSESLRVGS